MAKLNETDPRDFGFQDPQNDTFTRRDLEDTRRPKLTLRALNKLKKIRATKRLEQLKQCDMLEIMYGVVPEEGAPGGF